MAIPNEPLTRAEQYLNRTATGSGTIPDEPLTRVEMYLNKIATGSGNTPDEPLTRMEQYLDEIAENGGGGDIAPTGTKQISITENGTTTEDVAAYANAEIMVNVQSSGWDTVSIARNLAPSGRVAFDDAITIEQSALARRPITSLFAPNAFISYNGLGSCAQLETAVFNNCGSTNQFNGCSILRAVDQKANLAGAEFLGCAQLKTLILRKTWGRADLTNLNTFSGTPFASGGSGGTIYIPKALYDHLGDGTSLDYKAATNWATLDGYGTITWAQIEGSQYENAYVDGTPIE